MSVTRKRPLTVEGEGVSSKDSRDKEKKTVSQSRPPKHPAKRKKTADNSDNAKNQTMEAKALGKALGKGKRQAWTQAATDAFFEGLLQHGKDFQKILKYMQSKQKKLNDPTIGNLTKDQVRFFYYRNWYKVEPLLHSHAQHHSAADSRRASKSSAPQTPVTPFCESNEDSATEDHQGTETENYLDSSVEEADPASPSTAGTSQEQEVRGSPSPGGRVLTERNKEQVQASPCPVSTDKTEGKGKDTVLVNGTKQSLDLVALICYNKLRKKSLGDHNIGRRLSELVFQGVTTVPSRVKGKRKAQVRIPNCGAFRGPVRKPTSDYQPGSSESTTDGSCPTESGAAAESKLLSASGEEIVVELKPLTSSTWLHVQGLSHNPRIRMRLDGSGSLSTLRDYLALKWKLDNSYDLKFYDTKYLNPSSPGQSLNQPRPSHPQQSNQPPPSHPHSPPPHSSPKPSHTPAATTKREAVSLPCSPRVDTPLLPAHRDSHSVPATPSSEVTRSEVIEATPPERSRVITSDASQLVNTEPSEECDKSPPKSSGGEKSNCPSSDTQSVTENASLQKSPSHLMEERQCDRDGEKSKGGFTEIVQKSEVDLSSTLKELLTKLDSSRCVQLCYEITAAKKTQASESADRLRAALKLVEFFLKRCSSEQVQSPGLLTPVKKLPAITHRSPKVVEYMQTLNRHSPQKSPLSKYRRLKQKSPKKRISLTPSRTVNRVQLSFSSKNTPVDATDAPVSSTSTHSSSPILITTLKTGDKTPQAVQLASPKSIGSFANFKIPSLLPKPAKQPQTQVPSSTPQTASSSQQPAFQAPLSTQQSSNSLLTTAQQPALIPPNIISTSATTTVASPGYVVLSSIPSNVGPGASAAPAVAHVMPGGAVMRSQEAPLNSVAMLGPGVHRIQPRVMNNTFLQSSHDLVTPTLGSSSQRPKTAALQGDKSGGSNVVPIMSALKPFKKPKRIKKPPARPGQPHQLVPRPLPFLRDVNLRPSNSALSGPSVTQTIDKSQVTPALSASPLSVPKHSSPRKTTAALIQNQHLMLQLLQSYMLQQQRAQLGKSKQQTVANPPQASTSLPTTATVSGVQAAATSSGISEKRLESTVVNSFLAEGMATESTSASKLFNTSSDTVNNLLRGLSSVKPSNSIQKLSEETAGVLPTFAKALGDSFLSLEPKDQEKKESIERGTDSEADTGVCVDSEELAGPSVEDKMKEDVTDSTSALKPQSEDSQLPFLHDVSSTSLTDILGNLTDSNFKQTADTGDFFEHIDFNDMFSQLKDVMTPEKEKHPGRGEDNSQSSIGNLLEYVNCPPEKRPYDAPVDPACRSFLEEGSVDFIQKFKELASTMEGHSPTD